MNGLFNFNIRDIIYTVVLLHCFNLLEVRRSILLISKVFT